MNLNRIITGLVSVLLLMIGLDKFFPFLEPCTLLADIPPSIWNVLGVIQLVSAILIWKPQFKKPIAGFLIAFMLFFIIKHLIGGTYDIGGAVFMAALCGLLLWNPGFMRGKE